MRKRVIAIILTILTLLTNISLAADLNSTAGMVKTQSTSLNVRSGPSTSNAIVGKLNKGSYITLYDELNGWWKVEYDDGKTGYVSSDYIAKEKGSKAYYVNTESTRLNVRSGPGANYYISSKLNKGETVVVLSITNGWAKIIYDGIKIGYVSSAYLANKTLENEISLDVKRYAQKDSRWSYVKIGSNGNTIGDIGCLTTAVAMTESYRTGIIITPADIARASRYTASGALYWPSNYVTSYTSDYLTEIYELLKEGKPVLVGGRTVYGGQHWVAVTGYTGDEKLNIQGFTVSDPGNANRNTLAEFFSDYPVYYKIAYYK